MRSYAKVLLVLEMVFCFGLPFLGLFTGALFLVGSFGRALAQEPLILLSFLGLFLVALVLIAGLIGFLALINVLFHVPNSPIKAKATVRMRVCIAIGFIPLLYFSLADIREFSILFGLLPLIGGLHLLYLGRDYVFANPKI